MATPSQIQKDLIEWRRAKVIELVSKGKNLSEIAEILKVDVSTVSRDYQYIRENTSKVLEKYLVETVPLEMAKCLSRLTAISDETWSMVERAKDDKEKAAALALAQRTAVLILNIVTNNKAVVDDALKFTDSVESKGRQKEARSKIDELSRKKSRSKESDPAETVFNFRRMQGKPFWIWDREVHRQRHARTSGNCCFNHIIGLPEKKGVKYPLFDYEKTVCDALAQTKHVWIKKGDRTWNNRADAALHGLALLKRQFAERLQNVHSNRAAH